MASITTDSTPLHLVTPQSTRCDLRPQAPLSYEQLWSFLEALEYDMLWMLNTPMPSLRVAYDQNQPGTLPSLVRSAAMAGQRTDLERHNWNEQDAQGDHTRNWREV